MAQERGTRHIFCPWWALLVWAWKGLFIALVGHRHYFMALKHGHCRTGKAVIKSLGRT